MSNVKIKKQKSAALIIALLIVTFVGAAVIAEGKNIVQNNFATTRYTDALNANELAWAGIEDGLMRIRTTRTISSSGSPGLTEQYQPYWPSFNYSVSNYGPGSYTENVYLDTLFKRILRRNMSVPSASGNNQFERAGAYSADGMLFGIGLNYETPVEDSCNPVVGTSGGAVPFDGCANKGYNYVSGTPYHHWSKSDRYYDFRVSGSDDDIATPGATANSGLRTVNIKADEITLMTEKGYYHITKAEQENGYVDKLIDLSNYRGNKNTAGAYVDTPNQKIRLKYKIDNMNITGDPATTDQIMVNTVIKYSFRPDTNGVVNKNLSCYSSAPAGGWWPPLNISPSDTSNTALFYAKSATISNAEGEIEIPIPRPCGDWTIADQPAGEFENGVEYMALRFRLDPFGTQSNGCTSCSVSFGLKTMRVAGSYGPADTSFIGTGVFKIKATGIYNTAKKSVELWVAKDAYSAFADPDGEYFRCRGLPASIPADDPARSNLQLCPIKYYRQVIY